MRSVFQSLCYGQKNCILLIDKVYVKLMLLYHGGQLFGNSVIGNTQLAKTVLAFIIVCLSGGPERAFGKYVTYQQIRHRFLYD